MFKRFYNVFLSNPPSYFKVLKILRFNSNSQILSSSIKPSRIRLRLVWMNKRLLGKLGERMAEQRGWHWAMTSFALDAYGAVDSEEVAAANPSLETDDKI